MVLTGDTLGTRPLSIFKEPDFLALVDLLRNADVAITNVEMLYHDYENPPAAVSGGRYLRADPRALDELQWLGINMVCAANNHNYDFGENGLLAHLRHLRSSGLVFAGIGETLGEAREPRYLDTSNGRVALVACTTSGPFASMAGHQWRDGMGRPGANFIRHTSRYTVDGPTFEALKRLRDEFDLTKRMRDPSMGFNNYSWGMTDVPDSDTEFYLGNLHSEWQGVAPSGFRIVRGAEFEREVVAVQEDVEENLQRISDARRSADWVIVSMHSHEPGRTMDEPSNLAVSFAHAAIDAGADVFHGHGPHRDRGIEIYKGRPIFYSLGHFIVEVETVSRVPLEDMRRQGCDPWEAVPADFLDKQSGVEAKGERFWWSATPAVWRDVAAVVEFDGGELSGVKLQPIDLGFSSPRYQRGRPRVAVGSEAQEVLQLFKRLSQPFGTNIDIEGDLGTVSLAE